MRLSAKLAWNLAKVLTKGPQGPAVHWWIAALLRFALTGQEYRVTGGPQPNFRCCE
jgi:hypothetical protein